MSTIEDLQARIIAALDRVGAGVDALGSDGTGALEAVQAELAEERAAATQLEDRLQSLKDKQIQELEYMSAQLQDMRAKVDSLDLEQQRLRASNAHLREANAALRAANAEGVGDPDLINQGLSAELEALRVTRSAEIAEASAILSALTPILGGPSNDGESSNA